MKSFLTAMCAVGVFSFAASADAAKIDEARRPSLDETQLHVTDAMLERAAEGVKHDTQLASGFHLSIGRGYGGWYGGYRGYYPRRHYYRGYWGHRHRGYHRGWYGRYGRCR